MRDATSEESVAGGRWWLKGERESWVGWFVYSWAPKPPRRPASAVPKPDDLPFLEAHVYLKLSSPGG